MISQGTVAIIDIESNALSPFLIHAWIVHFLCMI